MSPISTPSRSGKGALSISAHYPYLVAAAYALIMSAGVAAFFPAPPPRFMDIYLIGIACVHARWSAGPAWLIYGFSLVFSWWILPPRGSLGVSEGYEVYRMVSYSVSALVIMIVIERLKSRH